MLLKCAQPAQRHILLDRTLLYFLADELADEGTPGRVGRRKERPGYGKRRVCEETRMFALGIRFKHVHMLLWPWYSVDLTLARSECSYPGLERNSYRVFQGTSRLSTMMVQKKKTLRRVGVPKQYQPYMWLV